MIDHPYASPETIVPGETADDDPFADEEFCEECDEYVEVIAGNCVACGEEVM
jgi:hypothetical protein